MSLITKFIDKNSPLFNSMSEDNPDLSIALLDALAIMGQYMEDKNIVFTEEEENRILESTEPIVFETKVDAELNNIQKIVEKSKEEAELKPAPETLKGQRPTWELLKLDYAETLMSSDKVKEATFKEFWDKVKEIYYGSASNIPQQGYDKLFIKASFFGRGKNTFEKERLDVGYNDYNPFTSPNILFDDLLNDYIHKLFFCYLGFTNVKSQFGEGKELDYFLNNALKLFNFDFEVPREYFATQIVSVLKAKLESDYWQKTIAERKDFEINRLGTQFNYTPELQSIYNSFGKKYSDEEIKEILIPYVPKQIYDWLFNGLEIDFIPVYDLAWLTPNEDGDTEYVKNQLGMPFDYNKAYGFTSQASSTKGEESQMPIFGITRVDYESEKLPQDKIENEMIVGDILKMVVNLSRNTPFRVQLVDSESRTLNFNISYDAQEPNQPFSLKGDIDKNFEDSDVLKMFLVSMFFVSDGEVRKIVLQGGKDPKLDIVFNELNNQVPQVAPTTTATETQTQKEQKTHKKEKQKVAQIQHEQNTHIQKDGLNLSDEDIKALESLGDLEIDDLEDLDDLIENL